METHIKLSEEILKQAAAIAGPDSNFHKILMVGLELRNEGKTPVYLFDPRLATIEVITTDKLN